MEIRTVTPDLAVSPQIDVDDVATLAEQGFKMVINVRPDLEEAGQPLSQDIEKAVLAHGMSYYFIPIAPGKLTDKEVSAFATACAEAGGPVFSYCRTGTRAVTLWALSHRQDMPPDEIAAKAKAAGYDLPPAITGARG